MERQASEIVSRRSRGRRSTVIRKSLEDAMNPRTVDSLRLFCLTVVICSLPMAAIADPPTAPGDLK